MGRLAGLLSALALVFTTACVAACSGRSCTPALAYAVPDGPPLSVAQPDGGVISIQPQGVYLSGHESADCSITFSAGSVAAHYHLAARPSAAVDPNACQDPWFLQARQPCDVVDGPTPTNCFRTSLGCLVANFDLFDPTASQALATYLGSTTYDVTVSCNGDILVRATSLNARGQICAI